MSGPAGRHADTLVAHVVSVTIGGRGASGARALRGAVAGNIWISVGGIADLAGINRTVAAERAGLARRITDQAVATIGIGVARSATTDRRGTDIRIAATFAGVAAGQRRIAALRRADTGVTDVGRRTIVLRRACLDLAGRGTGAFRRTVDGAAAIALFARIDRAVTARRAHMRVRIAVEASLTVAWLRTRAAERPVRRALIGHVVAARSASAARRQGGAARWDADVVEAHVITGAVVVGIARFTCALCGAIGGRGAVIGAVVADFAVIGHAVAAGRTTVRGRIADEARTAMQRCITDRTGGRVVGRMIRRRIRSRHASAVGSATLAALTTR